MPEYSINSEILQEGIYALNTRRFGSVAEFLIKRLVKLAKGRNLFHDLYDDLEGKRVEVKFSRALAKNEILVTEDTVLDCIAAATKEKRLLTYEERFTRQFDCNIQQVKTPEFDVLYYGVFFSDCVVIFCINSEDIGERIYYSDKQHKGNAGEGQFHISQDTIGIHEENYLYRKLSYEELYDVLCE